MMLDRAVTALQVEEGWVPHVYKDHKGIDSIGFGFRVDAKGGMPREVGEFWLSWKLNEIVAGLESRWKPFREQPEDVQLALVLMAYQMGLAGLFGFHLMIGALERGDRETAAINALDSEWHRDEKTRARAERVADLIRGHG